MHRTGFWKIVLIALGLFLGGPAQTSGKLWIDSQVLVVGESAMRAIDVLGKPADTESLEIGQGRYLG